MLMLSAVVLLRPTPDRRAFFAAGVALALGVACRSLSLAFVAPFVPMLWRSRQGRFVPAIGLIGPAIGVLVANALYNRARFGTFDMNGYVFWCAMPYSQFSYTFTGATSPRRCGR